MATELKQNDGSDKTLPKIRDLKVAIVAAEWNSKITDALLQGAIERLHDEGYPDSCADVFRVPGTVELTFAASRLIDTDMYDAIIVLGCVIRGDTSHFDYVCQSVTQGITQLNADGDIPVIFGVLTTDNEQQALDRAGGRLGNKGAEAAECAIKMTCFNLICD
ncbi:MAG TPA: 6,7-dimethyl-8-ribityllumazine synthase [Candidatus Avimuribaculum pullicola]|nr:6,7-dimethyl-8-ribityllumazine synthase [Candidatus Avimuribaculum pullicola]